MEAASASPSSSTASTGTSTAAATPGGNQQLPVRQLPWPADELPIVELLSLLHWLQQHVVRLQLAPGGCADLYLNPDLEVYAAVRVPLLAMQSRPTLISGGSTGMGELQSAALNMWMMDVAYSVLSTKSVPHTVLLFCSGCSLVGHLSASQQMCLYPALPACLLHLQVAPIPCACSTQSTWTSGTCCSSTQAWGALRASVAAAAATAWWGSPGWAWLAWTPCSTPTRCMRRFACA